MPGLRRKDATSRSGTGPVQVRPAGVTASRGRDLMETLGAGLAVRVWRLGGRAQCPAATPEEGEPDGRPEGKG
jgi:hypothetical protein